MATEQKLKHGLGHYRNCVCKSFDLGNFTCPIFECKKSSISTEWCSSLTPNMRAEYSVIFSPKQLFKQKFLSYKINEEWFQLYQLIHDETHHSCMLGELDVESNFLKTISCLESLNTTEKSIDSVQIVCLGHHKTQLDRISEKPYLKKINLNNLSLQKHSGNEWAESRAFLSKELFDSTKTYIGYCSASWTNKFDGEQIDDLENWKYLRYLLNSSEKDRVVFCADINCLCLWYSTMYSIFGKNHLFGKVLEEFGYKLKHKKVPFCNQFIAHKDLVYNYLDYLEQEKIMDRVGLFVEKEIRQKGYKKHVETISRSEAWIMEFITCLWFSEQDYIFVPNAVRKKSWYKKEAIKNREAEFLKESVTKCP